MLFFLCILVISARPVTPQHSLGLPSQPIQFLGVTVSDAPHQQITAEETGLATPDKSSEVNIIIIQQN